MTLEKALYILATIHTREDDLTGFVVMSGVSPRSFIHPFDEGEYLEAWRVVRDAVHLPTAPKSMTVEKL